MQLPEAYISPHPQVDRLLLDVSDHFTTEGLLPGQMLCFWCARLDDGSLEVQTRSYVLQDQDDKGKSADAIRELAARIEPFALVTMSDATLTLVRPDGTHEQTDAVIFTIQDYHQNKPRTQQMIVPYRQEVQDSKLTRTLGQPTVGLTGAGIASRWQDLLPPKDK